MFRLSAVLAGLLSAMSSLPVQTSQPRSHDTNDYSKEAFVIEHFSCKEKFEDDGTAFKEDTSRVRIQSDAGVQHYSLLSFSYPSATASFEVEYVRVRKPDGSVVETPAESVQDMTSQITRQAPFYSDIHEKHVTVKGLSVGDVLEYQVREVTNKPLVPGQFWTSYEFTSAFVVLDELLEIRVPSKRPVKVKSQTTQPVITEDQGYRVYSWHSSSLHPKDQTNKQDATELSWQQARGLLPQPDVILSSFSSWDEVGRWYDGLQEDRVKPTAEITSKAAELTKGLTSEDAKIAALYDYVSTQYHYVGVAFGIGRYQPHSAAAVLENQYGDCKDKHTLLASLLTSVGIPAYAALISTKRDIEQDVPSPGQFDHVITTVPRGNDLVWLDTTAEVGPFRYLISPLRDKHALVITKDKPGELIRTPADPPYGSTQMFNMEAKLNDAGTLEGNAELYVRGDLEYLLRVLFRAVPIPQWKELGQRISYSSGFGGEVNDVIASSPEKTSEAFHFSYKYSRKDFGDWPNHRVLAPAPVISLLAPSDEESLPLGPLWLGPPLNIQFHTALELPGGYRPQIPQPVHVKYAFAQFDATYSFKDGKLISDRHVETLLREVPVTEREHYKQFAKALQNDYSSFIPLFSESVSSPSLGMSANLPTIDAIRNLPPSMNEEATRLESEARESMTNGDMQGAVSSLYRAVAADPKFTRAWVLLGGLLLSQKQNEAGIDAFHKAMAADPSEPAIPKVLGTGLMASRQFESAVPVWQDFIKAHPDDSDGPSNLARCFAQLKRYAEAADLYSGLLKGKPESAFNEFMLGSMYLRAHDPEKATAAFAKLNDLESGSEYLNDAAYLMANADLQLPLSLNYAEKAVASAEKESQNISLAELKAEDLKKIFKLAAYWDTLGWVFEKRSSLEEAEQYLQASWKLTQDGVVASHLCQLYRHMNEPAKATRMCRLSVDRLPLSQQLSLEDYEDESGTAQKNLKQLTGTAGSGSSADAADIVIHERTFKLARFLPGTESAEFFILLASNGTSKSFKVEDVKFISGSEKMKSEGKQLKSIDFKFPAPDSVPTKFVRRGILGCYQYTGCSFVLLDPASAQSLE